MNRLLAAETLSAIPAIYRGTPIELLIRYHNLGETALPYAQAQILVGMCMDNRKQLHVPENFAYILRTGGGNLRVNEFKVSFAIAIGEVTTIALLAHDKCGMVNLMARKEQFIHGLMDNAGWTRNSAEEHFNQFAPIFEIGNEIDFVISESERLRNRYPKIQVCPLYYQLSEGLLYFVDEPYLHTKPVYSAEEFAFHGREPHGDPMVQLPRDAMTDMALGGQNAYYF